MKVMIHENRFRTLVLLAVYLLLCFSALHSQAEATEYCEQRQSYVDPERGESCGIYENGISTAGTVDYPTKNEIDNARQEAITKSQDAIYKKLLSLAQQWSNVDLTPGEREEVLSKFRKEIKVDSDFRPCEKRGGKNRHFCAARSRLFLSDNSEKVEKIMDRLIDLKSHADGKGRALAKPVRYLAEAYKNKMQIFSDGFSLKKKIRAGGSQFSVYTMNLYYKKEDVDTRSEFYLKDPDAHSEMSNEDVGHANGNEIVVVMHYPVRYMDISDEFSMKYLDTFRHEEAQFTELNEDLFSLYNSADEALPENLTERQWVPFNKIKYSFPNQLAHWLMESGYYNGFVLQIDVNEDELFDEYYVRKRIRLVNTCDETGELTGNVQIDSDDIYVPDEMSADGDGYYSILLPKPKWNESGELSVSAPDFHEKTISLGPFYKQAPLNTRNDIPLVPDRRDVTFEITKSEDVTEDAFHLTYLVDSTKTMKLSPYFMNNGTYTETLSLPGGMSISSFAIKNDERHMVNLVDHVQDPDHICDELIRLQIQKISD